MSLKLLHFNKAVYAAIFALVMLNFFCITSPAISAVYKLTMIGISGVIYYFTMVFEMVRIDIENGKFGKVES